MDIGDCFSLLGIFQCLYWCILLCYCWVVEWVLCDYFLWGN